VVLGGSATPTFDGYGCIPPGNAAETFDFDAMTDDGSTDLIQARRGPAGFLIGSASPAQAKTRS
jgi:hypothetical protein